MLECINQITKEIIQDFMDSCPVEVHFPLRIEFPWQDLLNTFHTLSSRFNGAISYFSSY